MPLPHASEARPFYQAAQQRLDDAQYLLKDARTTGAVYLAGYAVECMLKALVLASTPRIERAPILASFRGNKAHDFSWLKTLYGQQTDASMPKTIVLALTRVATWSTDLRYRSGRIKQADADAFFRNVSDIIKWIDGRL